MLKTEYITSIVESLGVMAKQMAALVEMKESLEKRLSAVLEHSNEGQHTYYEAGYKIEVKASINYTLDKDEYEAIKNSIPSEFDPVRKSKKEVVTYNLDKSIIRNCKTYADNRVLDLLFGEDLENGRKALIKEKPRSLSVTIGAPA